MNEFDSGAVVLSDVSYKTDFYVKHIYRFVLIIAIVSTVLILRAEVFSQVYGQPYPATTNNVQSSYSDQSTVKQEIARLEIKVVRGGETLPISLVPRVKKGDVLKVRLLDEPIGGVKIDQTAWDWTLVVAYANPLVNKQKEETVAAEVQFRKTGWYKEYSFIVPFDSQPVFFLSPRAKYRDQIFKAMNKNFGELHKIGEKMVEISGAYAQISTFLNELQTVVNRNQYGNNYNPYAGQYGYNNPYGGQPGYNPYGGSYTGGSYTNPGQYSYSNQYGNYNNQAGIYNQDPYWLDQAVERLAKSFNIQMPGCWYANGGGYNNGSSYNTNNGSGSGYNNSSGYAYGTGYSGGGSSYGNANGGNYGSRGFDGQDFVARSQCVAKTVRLEDFDISVTRMWQQGGVFLAAELQKRYPQLAFYINIAAAAIDFIVKAFQKSPLRIVPTMLVSADNTTAYQTNTTGTVANTYSASYQTNFQPGTTPTVSSLSAPLATKFSLFSSSPPNDQGFLTAYPIVVQKWQAEPDPEVVRLNTPSLSESCLHVGLNLLKNTNLTDDWAGDTFTRDFKLVMTSDNGFKKEFPLRKNLGLGGWELNLSAPDAAQIPKIAMSLEGQIIGRRGFSEVTSEKFKLPVATDSHWEVVADAQRDFVVGGRRRIALRNTTGDCLCIQSVAYKPGFGGQFTFERGGGENSLQTSPDGRAVWFEVETTNFNPGQGTLEVRTFGGETTSLNLKLYPALPAIRDVRVARGDRQILVSGERLEQLRYIIVNGYRATVQPNAFPPDDHNPQITTKLAIFDDPRIRQTGSAATIELGLEDDRHFPYPQNFSILPARPAILADENNEIEGISDASLIIREKLPTGTTRKIASKSGEDEISANNTSIGTQLVAGQAAVFPITTKIVSVNIQNVLSDYEFKNEDLSIETRIEKSRSAAGDFLKPALEVLDWKTMRLKFFLSGDIYTNLGGRRIQFRIKDKARGESDWYTIKQTFVRMPQVAAVKCAPEMNGMCEMKGEGMDYVGQVSVDGGKNWYPGETGNLEAQPTADGASAVMIPQLINKKLLRLRLRDFPKTAGLFAGNYLFTSTVKVDFAAAAHRTTSAPAAKTGGAVSSEAGVTPGNSASQTPSASTAASSLLAPGNPPTAPLNAVPNSSPTTVNAGNSQLPPHPPNTIPGQQPSRSPALYPGAVQMMDEMIETGKPKP